jgi:MOSC domain-containing protein YiiM
LFGSPGHDYVGHFGRPPGERPIAEVAPIDCVAGQGIRGDRDFGHQPDFKGQIALFALEVFERMCDELGMAGLSPSALRRNVVIAGVDLKALIGREFEVQGIQFAGTGECRPCFWMNQAVGPGAEDWLEGRGGLRARILTSGVVLAAHSCAAA